MKKGIDYTGITVCFHCHDGVGNYVMHKRGAGCRDEHGCWDFGGGGLHFGESLLAGVKREVLEEYGVDSKEVEFIGFDEHHRIHEGQDTHWVSFRYKVLVDKEKVVNNEPHKNDEILWTRMDSLPEPLHSQLKFVLDKYKDNF